MKHPFFTRSLYIALLLATASPLFSHAPLRHTATTQEKEKPPTIKVLLSKNKNRLLLEIKGAYKIYDYQSNALLESSAKGKREYVTYHLQGMTWGDSFSKTSLRIEPLDAHSSILVEGIAYGGCIEIHSLAGSLHVVNEIDIERYLKSILACLPTQDLDHEVLEAMAIVARTNAYYLKSKENNSLWQVDAGQVDYQGNGLNMQQPNMEQALFNTRHMILTYNNAPFPATWTKDSAGRTADFSTISRKNIPVPPGVSAPFAAKERPKNGWLLEISKSALARSINVQNISDIELFEDKQSHKVYCIRIKEDQKIHNMDFATFQKAIGPQLKSNDFTIEVSRDKVIFKGYGQGDGTGLCLFSASVLADKGEKAQQILARFFPNTQLVSSLKNTLASIDSSR